MRYFFPFLLVIAASSSVSNPAVGQAERPQLREWTFLFFAGLDNDLDPWAAQLERGVCVEGIDEGLAVTVLEDRRSTDGLHLLSISNGEVLKDLLPIEDSTDPEVLYEFLRWTSIRYPARRYVVTLFGHGGWLDEMCRDDHPSWSQDVSPSWIRSVAVGDVLRRWSSELEHGHLELLFLQECGRASIEELYSFRSTATYILASQTVIFADHSYYKSVFERAASNPGCDGAHLGRFLMDIEKAYLSYTLVNGGQLSELPARLDPLIDHLGFSTGMCRRSPMSPCFCHDDECAYDLLASLDALSPEHDEAWDRCLEDFLLWLDRDLVVRSSVRCPPGELCDPTWCGLSVFYPSSIEVFYRHASLPIYRDCRWGDVISDM